MSEKRDRVVEVLAGRLYQSGSRAALTDVCDFGINAIVCVGDEEQVWLPEWRKRIWKRISRHDPRRAFYVRAPLIDADGMLDAPAAEAAAGVIVSLLKADVVGRTVLVHCDMGAFRSVLVAALAFADIVGCDPIRARMAVQSAAGRQHTPRGEWMREFEGYLERRGTATTST